MVSATEVIPKIKWEGERVVVTKEDAAQIASNDKLPWHVQDGSHCASLVRGNSHFEMLLEDFRHSFQLFC